MKGRLGRAILIQVKSNNLIRVELHLHTNASKDSLIKPHKLIERCKRLGIDRVAITDHNTIEGALKAKEIDPERVIIGEEVLTTQGELLGYFVKELVPAYLEPMDAIERLRKQGAIISIAHPFDVRGSRWTLEELIAIAPHIDAVEAFNARCTTDQLNWQAAQFADQHGLLKTVGSDAHSLMEVGRANLIMPPFDDQAGFLESLPYAQPHTRLSSPLVHLLSRYAYFKANLK